MTLVTIGFSNPFLFVNFFLSFPFLDSLCIKTPLGERLNVGKSYRKKAPAFLGSTVVRGHALSFEVSVKH